MDGAAAFLLVDDDNGVTRAVARSLAGTRACVVAASVNEARRHLLDVRNRFAGFVLDARLPDGCGLELLRQARETAPNVPALVLTGHLDAVIINTAYELGASCVLKPITNAQLRRFVSEAVTAECALNDNVRRRVAEFSRKYDLTPAAIDVLSAVMAGYTKRDVLALRGIGLNTLKSHVRQILLRSGLKSLEEVRCAILGPPAVPTARRSA